MTAKQSLILMEMGSDPRIPPHALGHVRDLCSPSISAQVRLDRLDRLRGYVPDLVDAYQRAS